MDIGLVGFESISRVEVPTILLKLAEDLSSLNWVTSYKLILTASIPVLKLVRY
jgi:hypothetical protein